MQVLVESRSAEATAPWRELAVRRAQFVLRRLVGQVPMTRVHLADVNGPRGGIDKECQVALHTDGHGTIVIHARASNWRSALDSALARAVRTLQALLGRRRAHPRSTPRRPPEQLA